MEDNNDPILKEVAKHIYKENRIFRGGTLGFQIVISGSAKGIYCCVYHPSHSNIYFSKATSGWRGHLAATDSTEELYFDNIQSLMEALKTSFEEEEEQEW